MTTRPFITITAVLLLAMAGCIGLGGDDASDDALDTNAATFTPLDVERLSQPVHDLAELIDTFHVSHDGTPLHTAIYRPDVGADEKTPVVLVLSPYFGNLGAPANGGSMDDYWIGLLVSRGYTVVHASVRGTGYSGGCYELGGAAEVQDAYELVKHFHEAEWSNGNVGLIGVSYVGTTPWQAAITDPPGLKTIVPISGISDMYRYMYVNGASYFYHGPLFPTYYAAVVDWAVNPSTAKGPDHLAPVLEFACPEVAERTAKGIETMQDGDHDAFWDERDYEAKLDRINASVFLVHGLQDWNVDPDNGLPIFDQLPSPKKAWLGQWAHNVPFSNSYMNDEAWERHDWNVTLVAWFDHFLKGQDTGILEEAPVLLQASNGLWHREAAWPPTDGVVTERMFLAPDGALAWAPVAGAEPATMRGGLEPVQGPGPLGAVTPPTGAMTTLTFTSEPVTHAGLIVGQPTLTLNVTLDKPNGHLVAHLYDADAEDKTGYLGHALHDLAHRDSRDEGEPMTPGQPAQVTLTFFPMDAYVPEGHRLQLVLMPDDTSWIYPSTDPAAYEIALDAGTPASLALDIMHAPAFEEAPKKADVPWSS